MKIAGRFKSCAHMGCFDLEVFVELNQRSRKASTNHFLIYIYRNMNRFLLYLFYVSELPLHSTQWQCPICLKNYSLENIIIDPYFNRITSKVLLPCPSLFIPTLSLWYLCILYLFTCVI
jgi:hypothetical protein